MPSPGGPVKYSELAAIVHIFRPNLRLRPRGTLGAFLSPRSFNGRVADRVTILYWLIILERERAVRELGAAVWPEAAEAIPAWAALLAEQSVDAAPGQGADSLPSSCLWPLGGGTLSQLAYRLQSDGFASKSRSPSPLLPRSPGWDAQVLRLRRPGVEVPGTRI